MRQKQYFAALEHLAGARLYVGDKRPGPAAKIEGVKNIHLCEH
ncbi:MAG: hypothetical protein ACREHF_10250 [Rhizomicrobium sp.]